MLQQEEWTQAAALLMQVTVMVSIQLPWQCAMMCYNLHITTSFDQLHC